jgi:hypothetical protein
MILFAPVVMIVHRLGPSPFGVAPHVPEPGEHQRRAARATEIEGLGRQSFVGLAFASFVEARKRQ